MAASGQKSKKAKRQRAHKRGLAAETWAAWYLRLTGWRILKRRYKTKAGEIDLIAKKRKTVAFVEVKARKTRDAALEAVTPASQKRIAKAAKIFVSQHPKAGFLRSASILWLCVPGLCLSGLKTRLRLGISRRPGNADRTPSIRFWRTSPK